MSQRMSFLAKAGFLCRAWHYRWKVAPAPLHFVLRQLRRGHTCVEVGGFKGAWTYWMQKAVGDTGKVFTFEPQPELVVYLRSAQAALNLHPVEIVSAAVSSNAGAGQLFRRSRRASSQASLEPQPGHRHSLPVRVETLDEFFIDRVGRPIDLIRCGAAGHELEVFRGAEAILAEDRPILLWHCDRREHGSPAMVDVFDYLAIFEYEGEFFHGQQLRPLAEFSSDKSWSELPREACSFVFRPKPGGANRIDASEWILKRKAG